MTVQWSAASVYAEAVSASSELDKAAKRLARIREEYHIEGTVRPEARPRVIKSWDRCRRIGIDPDTRTPATILENAGKLHSANERMLRAADPVLSLLAVELAGTGYAAALADASGYLLRLDGDLDVRVSFASAGFVPGADLSEASAGTNAIGTVIADRRAFQLVAGEHFCHLGQRFACTGAPIFIPGTRDLAGVLAITGSYRLVRSSVIDIVMQHALEIEEQLAAESF